MFLRQIVGKYTNILVSWNFFDDIWQPSSHKKWEGRLLERGHLLE